METGSIPLSDVPGGLDLRTTLESGQTYLWRREDGRAYESTGATGADAPWYYTATGGEVVRVRQREDHLEWEATADADPLLAERLRLGDDVPAILDSVPDDPLLADARETAAGLRIVSDPFFPCLISFICSAQMRVERIYAMQTALSEAFGERVAFDGETYHAFPTPERLAAATESELRELGLGYRAPYVQQSAELAAAGELSAAEVREMDYEAAREALQTFVGVGDKVADCVLLFSLGFLEAVPLDTWIRTAIEDYYPDCDRGSYAETSRAIREAFGGEYAGYAQTYVFHHLRTQ